MDMKVALDVLNRMEADGVIGPYAISGAVASIRYLEPRVTQDLDILLSFESKSGVISLAPIFSYLKDRGYDNHRDEGVVIAGWPVQFIPVVDNLDAEALANAVKIEIELPNKQSVTTRILQPEYLVAIALRTGRPKDQIRMVEFVESESIDSAKLCGILRSHELIGKWRSFCGRVGIADPCG